MPIERRKNPVPDPEDFANPKAEKMFWSTERLLDEAPEIGMLKWHGVYDAWRSVQREYLEKGEDLEESTALAWGTLAFFTAERLNYIVLEIAQYGMANMHNTQLRRELDILMAWTTITKDALEEDSDTF